jgi:hypothetical protein
MQYFHGHSVTLLHCTKKCAFFERYVSQDPMQVKSGCISVALTSHVCTTGMLVLLIVGN